MQKFLNMLFLLIKLVLLERRKRTWHCLYIYIYTYFGSKPKKIEKSIAARAQIKYFSMYCGVATYTCMYAFHNIQSATFYYGGSTVV